LKHPWLVGNIAGWVGISIWAIYQIPQVIKIYSQRSVFGFSFLLASMVGFGDSLELLVSLFLGLPFQSVLNNIRGILIYLIFCVQFWLYKKV